MPAEFIFTTYRLARHHPPDRTVLEDISISFYPGAKIGVIGPNGAGKSSLLRIMAGLDDGFTGEARLTPGFTVGLLPQEPQLDPAKDVKGNVMDGVAEVRGLLDQHNAVMAKWSEPDADYEAIGAEQSALEDRINGNDHRDTISEREAAGLRHQLDELQDLFRDYNRNGLTATEMNTLQARINRLNVRLGNERRDPGGRRG